MNWRLIFEFLLTLVSFKFCESLSLDAEINKNIQSFGIRQDVPNVLKRFYFDWSQKDSCLPEQLKSFEVQVKKSMHPRYEFRIQIIQKSKFIKAELWIEFHALNKGIMTEKIKKRKYFIDVKPDDSRMKTISLQCSSTVANRSLAEMSFDITGFYSSLEKLRRKSMKVLIHLRRRKARVTREFRGTSVKAFVVLHEKNKDCKEHSVERGSHARQSLPFHPQISNKFIKLNEKKTNQTGIYRRVKREAEPKLVQDFCSLKDWQPSFEDIGFDQVIIAPSSASINICTGECVNFKDHLTNYAVIRRFLAMFNAGPKTCCAPVEYGSMMFVQYDWVEGIYIVTQYSDMIAKSCGCY
ncbi:UNVERIFIED_CONTAM: gbb [Trichonephila clavipes]